MSTLIVEVCAVEEILKHPNADKVELVRVKNWLCVAPIGQFKAGDKCVYFPPDSVISEELAVRFGIDKYCAPLAKNADGSRPPGLRIRAARFRGEPSFGTIQNLDDPTWEVGRSLLEHYGVTKYEPPVKTSDGDAAPPVSAFHSYSDIENLGNFPGVFEDGEEVTFEEKIHGTNTRMGLIFHEGEWQFMCGSNSIRRKEFNDKGARSLYWSALSQQVQNLLDDLAHKINGGGNVVLFGEIYGPGVQDMAYGMVNKGFRAFDIAVNGKYLDYDEKAFHLDTHTIERAPFLYRGPFSMAKVREYTDGPTTLCPPDKAGKFAGREGIVIRPVKERYSEKMPNFGRVILKSISVDYMGRKGGTEFH